MHVGHFMSSSTPMSRSCLCFCAFSFQYCFKKGRVQCVSLMVKIPVRYVAASVFTIAFLNFAQSSPFLTMSRLFEIVFSLACLETS